MPSRRRAAYGKRMAIATGLTASITLKVGEGDTAIAVGSGDVPVLATPRLVALLEEASVAAIADRLDPEKTSVTAEATLEGIEGRRLTFRVSVNDARGLVAAGRLTRVVVVRDRFVERAQSEV